MKPNSRRGAILGSRLKLGADFVQPKCSWTKRKVLKEKKSNFSICVAGEEVKNKQNCSFFSTSAAHFFPNDSRFKVAKDKESTLLMRRLQICKNFFNEPLVPFMLGH